jgi:hypothetical protein
MTALILDLLYAYNSYTIVMARKTAAKYELGQFDNIFPSLISFFVTYIVSPPRFIRSLKFQPTLIK